MPKKFNYIYFCYFGYETTVIESQVLLPLRKLQERGVIGTLVFMESIPQWLKGYPQQKTKTLVGLTYLVFPRLPRNIFWINTLLLVICMCFLGGRGNRTILHARGLQGGALASSLKSIFRQMRVVTDVRGVESEEYRYSCVAKNGKLNLAQLLWKKWLERLEEKAIRCSDALLHVSKALERHFDEKIPAARLRPWTYIPCSINTREYTISNDDREKWRKEWGWDTAHVIVYNGSCASWQRPEDVIRIFKILHDIDSSSVLLLLTPEVEEFKKLVALHTVPETSVRVLHAAYHEMPRYLAMADTGLLLRDEALINYVSCPTKFSDYLAAGLHVITTRAIADVAAIVEDKKIGTLIDLTMQDSEMKKIFENMFLGMRNATERQERSRCVAREQFDWDRYIPVLNNVYQELAQ